MTDKEKEQAGVRMTQEEIISQLENLKSHCEDMHKRNDIIDVNDVWKRDVEALTAAIKAVEQQPRWIPCSERLPERDESVLAYHRNVLFDYQYVSWIDDYSGKWADFCGSLSDEVLAWMPLPEGYKEKKGSDGE